MGTLVWVGGISVSSTGSDDEILVYGVAVPYLLIGTGDGDDVDLKMSLKTESWSSISAGSAELSSAADSMGQAHLANVIAILIGVILCVLGTCGIECIPGYPSAARQTRGLRREDGLGPFRAGLATLLVAAAVMIICAFVVNGSVGKGIAAVRQALQSQGKDSTFAEESVLGSLVLTVNIIASFCAMLLFLGGAYMDSQARGQLVEATERGQLSRGPQQYVVQPGYAVPGQHYVIMAPPQQQQQPQGAGTYAQYAPGAAAPLPKGAAPPAAWNNP